MWRVCCCSILIRMKINYEIMILQFCHKVGLGWKVLGWGDESIRFFPNKVCRLYVGCSSIEVLPLNRPAVVSELNVKRSSGHKNKRQNGRDLTMALYFTSTAIVQEGSQELHYTRRHKKTSRTKQDPCSCLSAVIDFVPQEIKTNMWKRFRSVKKLENEHQNYDN